MNTSLDRNEAAALETGEINTGNFLRTFPKEKRGDQIKTSYKEIKDPDNGMRSTRWRSSVRPIKAEIL